MSVTVISKRIFKMKYHDQLVPLLKDLREHAKKQKGFISRKTYSSISDPGEYVVISKWRSKDSWQKWMNKKKTRDIQGKIDSLIGEKTGFDLYKPEEY